MPSMRGTEKPQMSASSTPTRRPRAASAAARLTVTEDLPTPPLPDAMAMTRVVAGTMVSGADSLTFQRARAMARAFSSAFISVQSSLTPVTPGSDSTRATMSFLIWARSGQPAVVRAMVTVTVAVVGHVDRLGHAEIDDVAAQLGVDDAAEQVHDLLARWRCRGGHAVILPAQAV